MLLNDIQIAHISNFHSYCRESVILSNFYKIHDEYRFLLFDTTTVKHIIWKHISVNVHTAQKLIKTIILKKRN